MIAYIVGAWFAGAVFLAGLTLGNAAGSLAELPIRERFGTAAVMLIICAAWPVTVPLYLWLRRDYEE